MTESKKAKKKTRIAPAKKKTKGKSVKIEKKAKTKVKKAPPEVKPVPTVRMVKKIKPPQSETQQ